MGLSGKNFHSMEITLTSPSNKTIKGLLNISTVDVLDPRMGGVEETEAYDPDGAAFYVVAVIMVYGLSIVLLIGSLAKRKIQEKDSYTEEKQIHQYLSQAHTLRERGEKENYRQLKRDIITLVNTKTPPSSSPSSSCSPGGSTTFPFDKTRRYGLGQGREGRSSDTDSFAALLEVDENIPTGGSDVGEEINDVFGNDNISNVGGALRESGSARDQDVEKRRGVTSAPTFDRQDPPRYSLAGPRMRALEEDTQIICDYDSRHLRQSGGGDCKLSMDADGNIWILQIDNDNKAPARGLGASGMLSPLCREPSASANASPSRQPGPPEPNSSRALQPSSSVPFEADKYPHHYTEKEVEQLMQVTCV